MIAVESIRELTGTLASDLSMRGVSAEQLAAVRPGGEENPDTDEMAELRYYGRLCALRAVSSSTRDIEGSQTDVDDRLVMEALASTSKVARIAGAPMALEGVPVIVFAKSAIACLVIHVRSLEIARLLEYARGLTAESESLARVLLEVLYQQRVCAWIACTPGPTLPFAEAIPDPVIPEPFESVDALSLVAICRTFDEVNWARLRALESLITPDDEPERGPRPTWSQFFASVAGDHDSPESVLRDRALVAMVANVKLNASAYRDAKGRANAAREG
jgi:hypothetical protein